MTSEGDAAAEQPSLPANRSFVVQFRTAPVVPPASAVRGRVEHLVSGESSRFDSWHDLQAFVEQVLDDQQGQKDPDQPPGRRLTQ